ncbi:MAG: hypothetical protein ACREFX_01440 [Opitutaceae bacterium]
MALLRQLLSPLFGAFPGVPPWLLAVACAVVGAALLWLASRIFKWVFVLAAAVFLVGGIVVAIRLAFGR